MCFDDMHSYDFKKKIRNEIKYNSIPKINLARSCHSCIAFHDKLFIIGGVFKDGRCSNDIIYFNFSNFRWNIIHLKQSIPKISGHTSFFQIINNEFIIFVFGGYYGKVY
jgi:hypothetical protein